MEKNAEIPFVIGIDGYKRSKLVEDRLNSIFASFFAADPAGDEIIEYLQAITMHAVVPPTEEDKRLRHQEGMRDLFRIIKERINKGKEGIDGKGSGGGSDKRKLRRRNSILRDRGQGTSQE